MHYLFWLAFFYSKVCFWCHPFYCMGLSLIVFVALWYSALWISRLIIHSPILRHWCCFRYFSVTGSGTTASVSVFVLWYTLARLSWGVELVGYRVCETYYKIMSNCFPERLCHFFPTTSGYGSSYSSANSPRHRILRVILFWSSNINNFGMNLHFQFYKFAVEYIFIYLLIIWAFFFLWNAHSCLLLILLFDFLVFLRNSFEHFLYTGLWNISQLYVLQIQFVACKFFEGGEDTFY